MSLPHFFLNDQVLANEAQAEFPLALSRDDAKHAKVLRLAPGEHVAVVDAAQDYFECEIVSFAEALPVVRIAGHLDHVSDMPHVCLVQGLAKGYGYTISLANANKYCPPTYEDWYAKTLAQMELI